MGGLREPETVKAATAGYAKDQDSVAQFVEECCRIGGGDHVQLRTAKVREAYEQWCHASGERPVTAKALTMSLKKRFGVEPKQGAKGARFYVGIALMFDAEDGGDGR